MVMREIKFRGKRLDNGEWVYGDLLHIDGSCLIYFGSKDQTAELEIDSNYAIAVEIFRDEIALVDPATVGQCTGLKDKNGKEIYEGDIISDGRQFNVKWDSRGACWTGEMHNDPQQKLDLAFLITHKQTRIIGNIHDNPELIKGGEQ